MVSDPGDCSECGFVAGGVTEPNAETTIRTIGPRYHAVLTSSEKRRVPDAVLRQRPDPGTWSALGYTAHMRDVIALWGWALHRILTTERPELPAADPDLPERAAAEAGYDMLDPLVTDRELSANAARMADKVATIEAHRWQRTARFGELEITPLWVVRKVAHEASHHLLDIRRALNAIAGRETGS